ncbi:Major facilitator superfamily domain-containing protein 9 [Stylophora pistillata]|uniref:Major facilitator superfamily domain-containing protein 9 n=1 Tax=Stylophora pistillata TaxID=50429 RepID=A0A2B4RMR0_STYPI|nr:Major facilitator superfamily domain-containing protein 9 [Stylophora pistillata]
MTLASFLKMEEGTVLIYCLYCVGFLDLFAVSCFLPLLTHRARELGASPSLVGVIGSIYGALQFFSSPVMGKLSDIFGRKNVLLISLFGAAVGYILTGIPTTLLFLALSRVPVGIFKHSQSVAKTYLSDVSPSIDHPKVFGNFNAFSSLVEQVRKQSSTRKEHDPLLADDNIVNNKMADHIESEVDRKELKDRKELSKKAGVTFSPSILFIPIFIRPLAISSAVCRVCTTNLTFRRGREDEKGVMLGIGNSLLSFARMISPALVSRVKMATESESESANEEFLGFDEEAQAAVFRPREEESESDVSVSSVATEELSDSSESEEEDDDDQWNDNNNPVEVSPFTAATGPTWGVAEDGTAIDFFYLMFPEDLIEHIVRSQH